MRKVFFAVVQVFHNAHCEGFIRLGFNIDQYTNKHVHIRVKTETKAGLNCSQP